MLYKIKTKNGFGTFGFNKNLIPSPIPIEGKCWFCFRDKLLLNREHLPPRSALNSKAVICATGAYLQNAYVNGVIDFNKQASSIESEDGCFIYENGVFFRRFCVKCNREHNYASEYKNAVLIAKDYLKNNVSHFVLPEQIYIGLLKQVLSMFLINCSDVFFRQYRSAIVEFIIYRKNYNTFIPPDYNIWVGLYEGPLARRTGIQSISSQSTGQSMIYGEISFSPFIFILASKHAQFKTLIPFEDLKSNNAIKIFDFKKFDLLSELGISFERDHWFRGITSPQESLYYRDNY
jgi:hypothetical protein